MHSSFVAIHIFATHQCSRGSAGTQHRSKKAGHPHQPIRYNTKRERIGPRHSILQDQIFSFNICLQTDRPEIQVTTTSKPIPRLLHRPLITLRPPTLLQPPPHIGPLPPLRAQLPRQHKFDRKLHHDIRRREVIATQKLARRQRQLRLQPRHIVLHISSHALLRGLEYPLASILDVPACIQDSQSVQSKRALCSMHPSANFCALQRIKGKQTTLLIICFA
jgi:hypothetical protein